MVVIVQKDDEVIFQVLEQFPSSLSKEMEKNKTKTNPNKKQKQK